MKIQSVAHLVGSILRSKSSTAKFHKVSRPSADSLQLSSTPKVFKAVDEFLNLGKSSGDSVRNLAPEERDEFFKVIAKLIQNGVIGYEYLEVEGKKEKHFLANQIGNHRLRGAEQYDDKKYDT